MAEGGDDPQDRAARRLRQIAYLRGLYEGHVRRFRAAAAEEPRSLARAAHAEMDALLEDNRRLPGFEAVSCRRGCSHCCNGPVEIRAQEAALLVDHQRAAGLPLDIERLERQSCHSVESWREQPAVDQACVFLDANGACAVYEVRPNTCRKLLVTSDPRHCDIGRGEYERIERRFCWEAEMMESAALEVFGLQLMPKALLAALREGQNDAPAR
ncbi:MAG: YkgJ family cysteine cluster protein [Burkholderiales bacterium]|nr:YkgJ family cysteine cluster protein [Burkholderiales bacterium]